MSENLPEIQPDQPPVQREGKRELVVNGAEVYLPGSAALAPGDPKLEKIVAEVLPDYAADLSEDALRRPKGYSILATILLLAFFFGLGFALYSLRPQVILQETSVMVPPPQNNSYAGEFRPQLGDAIEKIQAKRREEARRILSPVVDELLSRGGNQQKNAPIFYAYFSLFNFLDWDAPAVEQLQKLIALDRDEYRWRLFDILRQSALSREKLLPDERKLNFTRESLLRTMAEIDALRRNHADDPELTRQLDLCKCSLDLRLWRLKNHPYANDKFGEEDREEAWEIASQYPQDKTFHQIRRYLITRLLQDGTSGYYQFAGKRLWREVHLHNALRQIELEAAGMGEKKK